MYNSISSNNKRIINTKGKGGKIYRNEDGISTFLVQILLLSFEFVKSVGLKSQG